MDQAAAASLIKVESFKLELSPYRQIEPGMGTGHEITPPPPPPVRRLQRSPLLQTAKMNIEHRMKDFQALKMIL